MKRIFAFLFALFLAMPVLAEPSPEEIFGNFAENTAVFADMDKHPWAVEAVNYLYKNKMISGVGGGNFAPDLNVTRIEFIKMVCTASAVVDRTAEAEYSDVSREHWGYMYASSAKKAGFTDIYAEDFLGADTDITREDMAYIAYKAIRLFDTKELSAPPETFSDDGKISGYAKDAVYYLKEKGIINGRGNNIFDPKGTATRAEAAKIIYNVSLCVSENYLTN